VIPYVESRHTSAALALQLSAVVVVVAAMVVPVVVSEELVEVVSESVLLAVQTLLVQVRFVAQEPVYVPHGEPADPPLVPYMQYQSVVPSQTVPEAM